MMYIPGPNFDLFEKSWAVGVSRRYSESFVLGIINCLEKGHYDYFHWTDFAEALLDRCDVEHYGELEDLLDCYNTDKEHEKLIKKFLSYGVIQKTVIDESRIWE